MQKNNETMNSQEFGRFRQWVKLSLVMGLCLVMLGGCTKASRRWMGFERTPPDQTAIKTNPPLIMPPDFDLRPPAKSENGGESDKDASKTANDTRDILLKGNKEKDVPKK
ncbi:MAG: DUF3035 domain-containing protein [Alphaproteobacteria bacterium]|nr:DUF3035 domain-containing protein [Alphaproteobacteria bacterium]